MLALWSSVKCKTPGLSLGTGSGTDTEMGWRRARGMWREVDVINKLERGRWKKVSPGGIHPLPFSRNSPCKKVCASSASHQCWGGSLLLSASQGAEGSVGTWLCSPPPHPMPSRVACCSPVRSLPKGEEAQVHPSSSCRNGGSISHAGCYMAGFHGSGCPSRGCALSLFVCRRKGLCRLLQNPEFLYLTFLS